MTRQRVLFNLTCLSAFLIAGGVLSAILKYELLFDFLQYHYYNGFAFINNRHLIDLGVAGVPTYYNPLLDTLIYLLIKACAGNITLYYFIQGLPLGLLLFVFWKICLIFFDTSTNKGKVSVIFCVLIALTGFNVWSQIGTSSHDIIIAVLLLSAFYFLLQKDKKYFYAGFFLGSAAGLKLPAVIYCISCGGVLILTYKKLPHPIKHISIFVLGGFSGFMIFNGFWCWFLWKNFQNPFFPFWNAIFKSPWYPEINYTDRLHLYNLNLFRYIFLPFYLIAHPHSSSIAINADVSDSRLALLFILAFGYFISLCTGKKPCLTEQLKSLCLLILSSYIVWLLISANTRFTIPIEMCTAILIVYVAMRSKKPKKLLSETIYWSFLIIICFILLSTPFFSFYWGRRTQQPFLEESIILPEKTLILSFNDSAAYVTQIIENNPDAVAIGFYEEKANHWKKWNMSSYNKFSGKRDKMLAEHQNKIAVTVRSIYQNFLDLDEHEKIIKDWPCIKLSPVSEIRRILYGLDVYLCYPPEMKEKIVIEK